MQSENNNLRRRITDKNKIRTTTMIQTFNNFRDKFQERFNRNSILNLGEDSVRYDFFIGLMETKNLQTYQIQVEHPIHPGAYIPRQALNAKRNENPQIDLFLNTPELKITCEFGLFKRDSNLNGNANTTEKQFKLINDLLRLSLNKVFIDNKAYFICVADASILGAQMRGNVLPQFPADNYNFDYLDLNNWIQNIKSAEKKIDQRFIEKANQIQLSINAELFYNQPLINPIDIADNLLETRILIYRIKEEKTAHNTVYN